MSRDFLKGIFFTIGIVLLLSVFGIVTAVGFHTADEILPGTFTGNYIFDGKLGIGSDNPVAILDIVGSDPDGTGSSQYHGVNLDVIGLGNAGYALSRDGVQQAYIALGTDDKLLFGIDDGSMLNYNKMGIDRNGNVGIGTTSPTQKLDVNGKIRMRTQTSLIDDDDIVATKKYVDDIISNSWVEITTDTNSFDNNCEYKWITQVAPIRTFYASYIRSDYIMMDYSSTNTGYVRSVNKALGGGDGDDSFYGAIKTFKRC